MDNLLGEYLRARRELVNPEDVGVRVTGLRRVAGLRREEVATLAGISSDYYLRLEQGRDRHPSAQVLESLARVLQLDETATEYLLSLSRPPTRATSRPRRERVQVGIAQLLEVIGLPAFVEGRYLDVLASNAMARALSPALRVGENRLRSVFLDTGERDLYPDWEHVIAAMVASSPRLPTARSAPSPPWWPGSGLRSAPRATTRAAPSWSVSCRWPASTSGGCGRATT